MFEIDNEKKHLIELAKMSGIPIMTLKSRLATGWTIKEALSAPKNSRLKSIRKRSKIYIPQSSITN